VLRTRSLRSSAPPPDLDHLDDKSLAVAHPRTPWCGRRPDPPLV